MEENLELQKLIIIGYALIACLAFFLILLGFILYRKPLKRNLMFNYPIICDGQMPKNTVIFYHGLKSNIKISNELLQDAVQHQKLTETMVKGIIQSEETKWSEPINPDTFFKLKEAEKSKNWQNATEKLTGR